MSTSRDNLRSQYTEDYVKRGVTTCFFNLLAKMLSVSEEFKSFNELSKRLSEFEKKSCVQLYIRRSRSVQSAAKRTGKKKYNDALKYAEIDYACIHGGKNFKTSSTGKRPNQK